MNKYVICMLCCLASPAMAEDAARSVQACRQALDAGDNTLAASTAAFALEDTPGNREAYLCLGRAQGGNGDHAAAVAAFRSAAQLSTTPIERIISLTLLGNQYKSAKAYTEAVATYRQSLAIARSEKNKHFEMVNLNQIGESLQDSGDSQGALEHFQQGLKLAANDNERADCYAHLAAIFSQMRNHDEAIGHQIKSVVLEERSGDMDHYTNANVELGRIYVDAGQYASADKVLTKMLGLVHQAGGDAYWEARIDYLLGKVQIGQGNTAKGAELFNRGREQAAKAGAEELLKEIDASRDALKK